MVKYIRDQRNKRAYRVIDENLKTYTIDKGPIVGLVAIPKVDSSGKKRFRIISKKK